MKQTEILTHATHVNGWFPAVYNFRSFRSNRSKLSKFSAHVYGISGRDGTRLVLSATWPRSGYRADVHWSDWERLSDLFVRRTGRCPGSERDAIRRGGAARQGCASRQGTYVSLYIETGLCSVHWQIVYRDRVVQCAVRTHFQRPRLRLRLQLHYTAVRYRWWYSA